MASQKLWEIRVKTLEDTFAHVHKRGTNKYLCGVCGLSLMDPVHFRVDDPRQQGGAHSLMIRVPQIDARIQND